MNSAQGVDNRFSTLLFFRCSGYRSTSKSWL